MVLFEKYIIFLNIVGCFDVNSVVCICMLVCELLDGYNLVKFEVLGDEKMLYLNIIEILKVVCILIDDGFEIMVYILDDLIVV